MITKGKLMKRLKQNGIRKNADGKRLHELKTFEITKMYYDAFGGFKNLI